jgi:hypothetical protein
MEERIDIPRLFGEFRELADAQVEPLEFAAAAKRLGWSVREYEYAPEDAVVLMAELSYVFWPLIGVFSQNSNAGIPLLVLVGEEEEDSPYYRKSRQEFDQAFTAIQAEIERVSQPALMSGSYESPLVNGPLQYALWPGLYWFVALVQHHEGDANFGHGPTLDLRLLPRETGVERPAFPMETDLIF